MTRLALLAIILLGACSDLSDIDANVCGNGILEPGEDCDASDDRCMACGIRCDLGDDGDAQCAGYPGATGFVCGADGLCHAPSGRFRGASDLSTSIDTFRATDINSDGYDDVIVQSATAIRVLFGNADGAPAASQQVLTPIGRGEAFYADLDADPAHKLDVLLPASDGIVAYTSPYGVLSPFPFPSLVNSASEGTPYFSNQIEDGVIGVVGRPANTQPGAPLVFYVRDVAITGGNVAEGPLCGATETSFDPHAVSIYNVRTNYQLFATTFVASGKLEVCVLAIERIGAAYTVTPLTVNVGLRIPASRVVLAPIGAGVCPSVVVRDQVSSEVVAFAGTGTTTCSYSGAPQLRALGSAFGDPVGWAPLVPADSATGATIALALTSGVFAVPASGPLVKRLYAADRPLSAIQSADLDGDGDVDIVASSATGGELAEDIDLLSRFVAGFTRYRVDTEGPVDLLTIGDYDGNGIRDVGYVQTRVIDGVPRYELVIAYATADQLLPGVSAGTFGSILSLIPVEIPDSNDPFNIVTDLVVMYRDSAEAAITILHGSPQRTLLGFFDPRASKAPTIFRGVVSGNFNDAPGTPGLDMIGIEDGALGTPNLWRSNGPTGAEVDGLMPATVSLLTDCSSPALGNGSSLCIAQAFFLAWPISEGRDRVVALGQDRDNSARIVTFDPHGSAGALAAAAWPPLAELPPKAKIRRAEVLRAGDVSLLLIGFSTSEFHLLACSLDTAGLPVKCSDVGAVISAQLGSDFVCTHASVARIRPVTRFMKAPPVGADLVAICFPATDPETTVIFQLGADLQASELLRVARAREVRIGDIDGNGIDDLLTVDRETAVPTLRIYRQCTSREAQTCGR